MKSSLRHWCGLSCLAIAFAALMPHAHAGAVYRCKGPQGEMAITNKPDGYASCTKLPGSDYTESAAKAHKPAAKAEPAKTFAEPAKVETAKADPAKPDEVKQEAAKPPSTEAAPRIQIGTGVAVCRCHERAAIERRGAGQDRAECDRTTG
jgi:hypothetical protein